MKVSELEGALLDQAVAKWAHPGSRRQRPRAYSSDWRHGGPLIDEGIALVPIAEKDDYAPEEWVATIRWGTLEEASSEVFLYASPDGPDGPRRGIARGPTPLVAAMRAYVLLESGEEVEL